MHSVMERWIGNCQRELLDRTLVWNQRRLMIVLREYEDFYNSHRPQRTLNQAAPLPDGVTDLDQFRVRSTSAEKNQSSSTGSASLLTQTICRPRPENTVPTSPNGVDQTWLASPRKTLKTCGPGSPPSSAIIGTECRPPALLTTGYSHRSVPQVMTPAHSRIEVRPTSGIYGKLGHEDCEPYIWSGRRRPRRLRVGA